ncbi:MAG: hypothetical protein ACW98W_19940 [Candidatus Hodarchaeales archaeon]|jgi:DNA-directed RNA polymerase specialized sigma subunit
MAKKLSSWMTKEVIELLKDKSLSMKDIANRMSMSRNTVTMINQEHKIRDDKDHRAVAEAKRTPRKKVTITSLDQKLDRIMNRLDNIEHLVQYLMIEGD